jgi:ABC-type phosphate transport system permease subunit
MKDTLLGIIILAVLIVGVPSVIYGLNVFFAPKYAELNREVMKQSQAFQDGAIRNIRNYQVEYLKATDEDAKAAIKAAIMHELNSFNRDNLPSDLKTFVESL